MMNLVTLILQLACFAFLVWGGILSVQYVAKARDPECSSRELQAA
jgi:threonine/homoserine/homoserine lactone efflux protein